MISARLPGVTAHHRSSNLPSGQPPQDGTLGSTIENFLTGAALPSLLKEHPRFEQSRQGSFWRRAGYAISSVFVTRNGNEQFNYSEIVGSALSAGISTSNLRPGRGPSGEARETCDSPAEDPLSRQNQAKREAG